MRRINKNRQEYSSDWFKHGRDSGNTFYVPISITTNLNMKHNPIAKGNIPWTIVNGILYVIDSKEPKTVYAVDLQTNAVKWSFTVEGDYPVNYVMARDNLVFLLTGKTLYSLINQGDTYEIRWKKQRGPGGMGTMNFDENNIYHTYVDSDTAYPEKINRIMAVDINTGADKWLFNLKKFDEIPDDLTCGGGKVYFIIKNVASMESNLFAIDGNTSIVQWTAPLYPGSSPSSNIPVYSDGKVFLDLMPVGKPNTITAYDGNTGRTLWRYTLANMFSVDTFRGGTLGVNDNSVVAMDRQGYMFALDKEKGTVRWSAFYADRINIAGKIYIRYTSMPAIITKDKILIENNGKIKIFDVSSGSLLKEIAPLNLKIAPLAIGGRMLITTDGTRLYAFNEEPPISLPPTENYIVKAGDTLSKIAIQFSTTVQKLMELNNITNSNLIHLGQMLTVPSVIITPPMPVPEPNLKQYIVNPGDTLGSIAMNNGITISEIVKINNITNPNFLYIGQKLMIPVKGQIIHTVASGESIWLIATKYNVTTSSIIEKNNLVNPNLLSVGQKLIIK